MQSSTTQPRILYQMQAHREELVARITQAARRDGEAEVLPGLWLHRGSAPTEPLYSVSQPAFCMIAQGSKMVLVGDQRVRYDPAHYLLATAEIPFAGQIIEASPARPYLSVRLQIDAALVGAVMIEARQASPRQHATARALDVSPVDGGLLDAMVRCIRLVDAPADARFLMPLITREIIYRLLLGEQGGRLRQIAVREGATHRIVTAIERIKRDFQQPLRIEQLAQAVGMSVSGFHQHFKAVTAMSPGQFQKQLRLQEARRLLIGEQLNATMAGARVGYDDPAYFTREYKRLFGAPPMQDVARVRDAVTAGGSL